jgi:hypothetical protein
MSRSNRRPRRWTTDPFEHLPSALRAAFGRGKAIPAGVSARRCAMLAHAVDLHSRCTLSHRLDILKLLSSVAWARAPDRWVPGAGPLFRDFTDHLLRTVQYPLPQVLYDLVLAGHVRPDTLGAVQVLARVGSGASLAELVPEGLVAPLTRRGFHVLWTLRRRVPTWTAAARIAAIVVAGGSVELGEAVGATFLRDLQRDERYWVPVLAWLGERAVPPNEVGPLLDFVRATGTPPSGSLARVQRAVTTWHRSRSPAAFGPLPEAPWSPWTWEAGGVVWSICPLRTGEALTEEGVALRHCVATYADRARTGAISLWSVKRDGARALTLEVTRDGAVVQARGASNRLPTPDERTALAAWAAREGLVVTRSAAGGTLP